MTLKHSARLPLKIVLPLHWILLFCSSILTKFLDQLFHPQSNLPISTLKMEFHSSKLPCNLTRGAWRGYLMILSSQDVCDSTSCRNWIGNANWKANALKIGERFLKSMLEYYDFVINLIILLMCTTAPPGNKWSIAKSPSIRSSSSSQTLRKMPFLLVLFFWKRRLRSLSRFKTNTWTSRPRNTMHCSTCSWLGKDGQRFSVSLSLPKIILLMKLQLCCCLHTWNFQQVLKWSVFVQKYQRKLSLVWKTIPLKFLQDFHASGIVPGHTRKSWQKIIS